jgi:hypothetical protein
LFFLLTIGVLCICIYSYFILAVNNNDIQDNANTNIDKDEMICEHDDENFPTNNTMICIHEPPSSLLSPSYFPEHDERTISSSSSEQLIPKQKQTGKKKKKKEILFYNLF